MIYLASPYSHPDSLIRKTRFLIAEQFIAHCHDTMHVVPFSPIVYLHKMAEDNKWPGDAGYWRPFNMNMLRKSDALFALKLDGWEESKGMALELKLAKMLNIPITSYNNIFAQLIEVNN